MERLHNLKQNYMNIARIKSEAASLDNNILNINNSFNKSKSKESNKKIIKNKNKLLNNDNETNKNMLNINNSKTLIPQNFVIKKDSILLDKIENSDTEKNLVKIVKLTQQE